jgi:hypothetical protein
VARFVRIPSSASPKGVFIVQAIGIIAGLFLWMFEKSVISCGMCLINCTESAASKVSRMGGLTPEKMPDSDSTSKLVDRHGDGFDGNGDSASRPVASGWLRLKSTLRREVQGDVVQWGLSPAEQACPTHTLLLMEEDCLMSELNASRSKFHPPVNSILQSVII